MKAASSTESKEESRIKIREEYDITVQRLFEEEKLKREEVMRMKAEAATQSNEEGNMTANALTADASEDYVKG